MKTKFIRALLFILTICWSFGQQLYAQNSEGNTAEQKTEFREFDKDKLEGYRSDKNFEYTPPQLQEKGPFQRFVDKVIRWFASLFGSGTAGTIWDILLKLVLLAAFVLFVVKIAGFDGQSIFKPTTKKKVMAYTVDEESLDQINFDEEIQKALQSKQWRLAIRLVYLSALKHLADTNKVVVVKGKTNHEYLYELGASDTSEDFSSLSFLFDYTWYGHFEANEPMTDKARTYLDEILKKGETAQ